MSQNRPAHDDQWWDLLDAVAEGGPDDERWPQIDALLQRDAEFRHLYVAHTQTLGQLRWSGRNHAIDDAAAADELSPARARGSWRRWTAAAIKRITRPTPLSMSVAALVILLLIAGMAFMAPPFYRAIAGGHGDDDIVLAAELSGQYDAVWQGERAALKPGSLLAAGRNLSLKSGFAELTFKGGAKVLLEGPAVLELHGDRYAKLQRGQLTVHDDTLGPEHFALDTPHAEIIDLGTRFGVAVDEQTADIAVFEGAIDVAAKVDGKLTGDRRRLTVDEALRVEGGRIVAASETPARRRFVQQLHDVGPAIAQVEASSGLAYRIAEQPLGEDAVSHTDRPYQWNGLTEEGIPAYLIGAEYVQPAMDDKTNTKLRVKVTIRRPGTLYLFVSAIGDAPKWVHSRFEWTGDQIGLDDNVSDKKLGTGPGQHVDQTYDVWRRKVSPGEVVVLGPPQDGNSGNIGTYGIAVAPRPAEDN